MQIVKTKSECDHVQFLITDTSGPGAVSNPMIAELETLSVGEYFFSIKRSDTKESFGNGIGNVMLTVKKEKNYEDVLVSFMMKKE